MVVSENKYDKLYSHFVAKISKSCSPSGPIRSDLLDGVFLAGRTSAGIAVVSALAAAVAPFHYHKYYIHSLKCISITAAPVLIASSATPATVVERRRRTAISTSGRIVSAAPTPWAPSVGRTAAAWIDRAT